MCRVSAWTDIEDHYSGNDPGGYVRDVSPRARNLTERATAGLS